MRLIYTKDGFSKNEKEEWRIIIFQNIIDGLRMIIDAMEEFNMPFEHDNTTVSILDYNLQQIADQSVTQVHLPIIMEEKDLHPFEPIPTEYLLAFKDMWKDGGVQKAVERGNEYALHDNLG